MKSPRLGCSFLFLLSAFALFNSFLGSFIGASLTTTEEMGGAGSSNQRNKRQRALITPEFLFSERHLQKYMSLFDDTKFWTECLELAKQSDYDLNQRMDDGYRLLHYSVSFENLSFTRALLRDRSVEVNAVNDSGNTALHHAISGAKTEFYPIFFGYRGSEIKMDIPNNDGETIADLLESYNIDLQELELEYDVSEGSTNQMSPAIPMISPHLSGKYMSGTNSVSRDAQSALGLALQKSEGIASSTDRETVAKESEKIQEPERFATEKVEAGSAEYVSGTSYISFFCAQKLQTE